jgi:hypothetical protein
LIHRINLKRTIDLGHKMKKRVMALLVHNKTSGWGSASRQSAKDIHNVQVTQ